MIIERAFLISREERKFHTTDGKLSKEKRFAMYKEKNITMYLENSVDILINLW